MKFSLSKLTGFFTATLAVTAMLTSTLGCTASGGSSSSGDPTDPKGTFSVEGTVDGGGGKGVLCALPDGRSRLVTLDRFEAELAYGSNVRLDANTVDEALISIGERFALHTSTNSIAPKSEWSAEGRSMVLQNWKEFVGNRLRPISAGARLSPTADATLPPLPKACKFVQIAVYTKVGIIFYDADYWARLEPMDVAILYAHEYFYSEYRKMGYKTSDETRVIIGDIISSKMKPMFEELWSTPEYVLCFGGGGPSSQGELYEFYLAPAPENSAELKVYFRGIGKEYVYTPTISTASLSMSMDHFLSESFGTATFTAEEKRFDKKWTIHITRSSLRSSGSREAEILIQAHPEGQISGATSHGHCQIQKQRSTEQL